MKIFNKILAVIIITALNASPANAYESEKIALAKGSINTANVNNDNAGMMIPDSYDNVLTMVTGTPTGTYFRFGHDIKDALKEENVNINIKESKGSITNIRRIGSNENAAFGIVQSDVLGFLSRSKKPESKKLASKLRMVFPFYKEEVHIIANKDIANFNELDKKNVVVGPTGSGSWLTAMNMFSITGVRPEKLRRLSPEEGMKAVLTGEADAMIFVAGKPVTLFETLGELSANDKYKQIVNNVHFVPITDGKLLKEYSQASLTSKEYNIIKEDVPTIAITAALVSYDFSDADSRYARARCDDIKRFSTALNNKIGILKERGHPKWKEVNLDAEIGLWKRDKCSSIASTSAELENEFMDDLEIKW